MDCRARHWFPASIAVVVLTPLPLAADPVADFYQGKQIRIVTGANAGDGYDLWSRFLARHIGRHIPGRPSIIVQNMPGAGTLVAANHLFNVAARDGTIIGSFSRSLPSQALLNRPNIRFDPRQFGWLGSPETINRVCAVGAAAKAKTIDDVFVQEVLVGGMGASMVPSYVPTLLNKLVGTKFRVVEGYGGTNAIFLAIERREVDGVCMASSTLLGPRLDLVESGALKVLFNMEAKTMAALPGVPTMFARLKTERDRQIVSFINSALEFGRPFTTPPGVPPERLAALQTALRTTVEDPEFLAEAKQLKLQITYTSPDELRVLTERMYATPRAIIEEAAATMPSE